MLASCVIDQLTISTWVYFWALYSVPLIFVSVFVSVPCCFDYCSFIVQSEVREHDTSSLVFFFLNGNYLFIYLFMAVLGLRFCARAFCSCGKRGPLFIAVRGPLTMAASLVAEHRLQTRRLSNCGSRA